MDAWKMSPKELMVQYGDDCMNLRDIVQPPAYNEIMRRLERGDMLHKVLENIHDVATKAILSKPHLNDSYGKRAALADAPEVKS